MMSEFDYWFRKQMDVIGYSKIGSMSSDECSWAQYKNDNGNTFHVYYAKKPITEAIIRTMFAIENEPILFVVDRNAIDEFIYMKGDRPLWVRALHAIYYGRVYVWAGSHDLLQGLHFEWDINNLMFSPPIIIDRIRFEHVESKLKAFPGNYYVAMFNDRAFWKEQAPPKQKKETPKERADKWREEWEQATKGHAEQEHKKPPTQEDINEAFKRAFREHMRNYGVNYDAPRRSAPVGDKWLSVLMATGSIEAARKKFKELAKQYHPDLNPGDATALATMQEISNAFDKVKEYLR